MLSLLLPVSSKCWCFCAIATLDYCNRSAFGDPIFPFHASNENGNRRSAELIARRGKKKRIKIIMNNERCHLIAFQIMVKTISMPMSLNFSIHVSLFIDVWEYRFSSSFFVTSLWRDYWFLIFFIWINLSGKNVNKLIWKIFFVVRLRPKRIIGRFIFSIDICSKHIFFWIEFYNSAGDK